MDSPDELYTLRAQFYLGHYAMSLDEARAISRRPLSNDLKIEREEFQLRALLGLKQYDKVLEADTDISPGVKAIAIRANYEMASEASKAGLILELQALVSDPSASPTAQLVAAQTFLGQGEMTKEALHCVYQGATMEHLAMCCQIYLKMDRLDLAQQTLRKMKQKDEEAVLSQLCACYIAIYTGSSEALEAVHIIGSLTEQYGACTMLLNLASAAYMAAGQYAEAETNLIEATAEGEDVDTMINLIVCYQHQGKSQEIGSLLDRIKGSYPTHPFVQGLLRVEGAFEREAVKYKVAA